MPTVIFNTTLDDDDETPVQVEAQVTTWRDEGNWQDSQLMASVEDMTVSYEDGSNVAESIVARHYSRWSDTACEKVMGN